MREVADRIGYTEGCPGCRAVKRNLVSRPVHTPTCRARMEPEMQKSARGAIRMEQWQNRLASEVEKRVREENRIAKSESVIANDGTDCHAQGSSTIGSSSVRGSSSLKKIAEKKSLCYLVVKINKVFMML